MWRRSRLRSARCNRPAPPRSTSAGEPLKLELFHRIRPRCPSCRAAGRDAPPLEIGRAHREEKDDLLEGALICPEKMCRREHPILDGIPILMADVRGFVASQLGEIRARDDFDPITENLLGDCGGPGSEFDSHRYQVSSYARGHYGDLDPERPAERAGSVLSLLDAGLELFSRPPKGLWLDLGCAVGRGTFELAARTGEPVLGIDLSFAMLRVAQRARREGRIRHPLRRAGLCYERREFAADLPGRDLVDFWICDANLLPFSSKTFAGAVGLNVLDCSASPLSLLSELGRVLEPKAEALLCTPYDWSASATPIEGWIGGHSRRGEGDGDPASELKRILAPGDPAKANLNLELVRELDSVPWQVYVHERASMRYSVHLAVARALKR